MFLVSGFGNGVSGFLFLVSYFGIGGFKFQVSCFRFWNRGFTFLVSCFRFWNRGFQDSGFLSQVLVVGDDGTRGLANRLLSSFI